MRILLLQIGFERSGDLADICGSRGFPVVQSDCLATPLLDNSADACLCIAVIHHLSTEVGGCQKEGLPLYCGEEVQ